ncbi:hypothetical protein AJ79_08871 [Helicocarpus griseus UAMH5409]|uniref:IgE-binding protein n=1 Tax=Helicocarpus griseus UAMH5409 TaxID=1447875 RepID=A0A2B7WPL6_9EURO|nr:hypothetical protein AJ79_08871 [Helicocarpus griseus UAMH5409]
MKSAFLASLLPLLAAAAPAPAEVPRFTVMAARSASPIHYSPMQATGRHFMLGGEPSTYCPQPPVEECPPGKITVVAGAGPTSSLNVMVPGGQQIYVEPTGALGFTQAHSAQIPEGSLTTGFKFTPGDQFGHWTFEGFGADGFMGCPPQNPDESPLYQVFANIKNATVPTGNVDDCLPFSALAPPYTGPNPAAWQYI